MQKDKPMEKVDLIYKLNGDFEQGINIFELSPTLLSVGQLISEAHKTLMPNSEPIAINVKPFKPGSLEIEMMMFAQSNLQQALTLIHSQTGKDISEVLQYLGFISGASVIVVGAPISLFKLIKKLKGKPRSIEKAKPGEYTYIDNSGNKILVPIQTHALFQNVHIQQTIYNGIAKPLENKETKEIECYIKNDERTKETIEKDIIEPIRAYSTGEIPSAEAISENINIRKLWVHPRRISVEGESNSWSFRIAGSEELLRVTNIKDEGFLNNIKSNRYRLAHSDKLYIEIHEKQKMQGSKESLQCEIEKVIDYVRSDEQISLEFNDSKNLPPSEKL